MRNLPADNAAGLGPSSTAPRFRRLCVSCLVQHICRWLGHRVGWRGPGSSNIAGSTGDTGNRLPILLLLVVLTRYAWLVDKAVILIPAIRARSAISRPRLVIKMAFPCVVVNAMIQWAQGLGARLVSPFYFWTVCVWIFFFWGVAGDTAKQPRPFQVANSL